MTGLFDNEENMEERTEKKHKRKKESKLEEPKSFEEALKELEQIVSTLESDDISLEESVRMFQKAQFLATWCQNFLNKVEGKLKLLIPDERTGEFKLEDLEAFETDCSH